MKPKPVRIARADATGFLVADGNEEREVRWAEVEQITGFKRDLYTVDMLCLLLLFGTDEAILELNEHTEGYDDFVGAMDTALTGAMPWAEWFMAVAFPAFATNTLCIYRRNGNPDPLPPQPPPDKPEPRLTLAQRALGAFWAAILEPVSRLTTRFEKRG